MFNRGEYTSNNKKNWGPRGGNGNFNRSQNSFKDHYNNNSSFNRRSDNQQRSYNNFKGNRHNDNKYNSNNNYNNHMEDDMRGLRSGLDSLRHQMLNLNGSQPGNSGRGNATF